MNKLRYIFPIFISIIAFATPNFYSAKASTVALQCDITDVNGMVSVGSNLCGNSGSPIATDNATYDYYLIGYSSFTATTTYTTPTNFYTQLNYLPSWVFQETLATSSATIGLTSPNITIPAYTYPTPILWQGDNTQITTTPGTTGKSPITFYFQRTNQGESLNNSVNVWFERPTNNTSFNYDFTHWNIGYENPAITTGGLSIEIKYSTSPTFSTFWYDSDLQTRIIQPSATGTISIPKLTGLNNGYYYAKVLNLGTNASTTIQFNISGATHNTWTGQTWPYTSSTLESTSTDVNPFYVDCTESGFFSSCSFKKAIYATIGFLVVPPDFISDYMKDSLSNLNTVFPFSILYSFTGAIDGSINSTPVVTYSNTSSTMPNGVSINILSATALRDIMTTPSCNSSCTQTKVDYIFDIIENVIWFMTAIAVIILII